MVLWDALGRNVWREVNTMGKLTLLFGLLGILAVVLTGCS